MKIDWNTAIRNYLVRIKIIFHLVSLSFGYFFFFILLLIVKCKRLMENISDKTVIFFHNCDYFMVKFFFIITSFFIYSILRLYGPLGLHTTLSGILFNVRE